MAKKKKKAAKKAAKTPRRAAKKTVRKAAAKRTAAKKAPARKAGKAKKKGFIARAVSEMTGLLKRKPTKAKKTPANREFGEGNYKASKRFRDEQESFVKTNKAKIPALGKAAEDALAGPEGDDLRAAEAAAAAGHSE